MEKDLVPLVDIHKKSVFLSSTEEELWNHSLKMVQTNVEIGFKEPKEILDKFAVYGFLLERTQKSICK